MKKLKLIILFLIAGGLIIVSAIQVLAISEDELLKQIYESDNVEVRLAAIEALSKKRDKKKIIVFLEILKHETEELGYASKKSYPLSERIINEFQSIGSKAVEFLIPELRKGNEQYKARVAEALCKIREIEALDPVVRMMAQEREGSRFIYFPNNSLEYFGNKAVDPLIELLEDEDLFIRGFAAEALGKIGNRKAVDPLIKLLESADNEAVVNNTAEALGILGDKRAVNVLISTLKNQKGSFINDFVVEALRKIGDKRAVDPLLSILPRSPDWSTIISVLGELGDPKAAVPILNKARRTMDTGEICGSSVSRSVVNALVQMGEICVPQILPYLEDDNFAIRRAVILTIGEIGGRDIEDPILDALEDDHPSVRKVAARSAGKIRLSRADKKLTSMMQDADTNVQIWAAYALYRLGRIESIDFLIDKLQSSSLSNLAETACALGETGDKRSIEKIVSIWEKSLELEEQESQRRADTGQSLVEYQFANLRHFTPRDLEANIHDSLTNIGSNAANYIVPLLRDRRRYVRGSAASMISELGWNPENEEEQVAYIIASRNWKECKTLQNANYLTPYLTHEYRDVWVPLFPCISAIGDTSIMNELVPILTYWNHQRDIVALLEELGWRPSDEKEQVYLWVARRDGAALKKSWQSTSAVLLKDIESKNYHTIENALYAFIGVGKKEIINDLVDTLNNKGNKIMAEAFLNCGHSDLKLAAEGWARRNGYSIVAGKGASPVAWGDM